MTAEKIQNDFQNHYGERVVVLEQSIIRIDNALQRIDARFDKVDARFNKIDDKFDKMNDKFDKMNEKFDKIHDQNFSHFKWIVGLIVTSVILPTFLPIILHAFKLV